MCKIYSAILMECNGATMGSIWLAVPVTMTGSKVFPLDGGKKAWS